MKKDEKCGIKKCEEGGEQEEKNCGDFFVGKSMHLGYCSV
jgi:hypothetical protein